MPLLINDKLGQHNDSRMNVALVMTAVKHGAKVANYTEVTRLHKDDSGKLRGARVKDNLTGEEWDVKCKVDRQLTSLVVLLLRHFRAS
jgi:glycerol-3-phosphate dehydrogenase